MSCDWKGFRMSGNRTAQVHGTACQGFRSSCTGFPITMYTATAKYGTATARLQTCRMG
jgi:hypothetical protein